MKGGEKKVDWLKTLGTMEQHSSVSPGFSFSFIYPGPGAEKAGKTEMSMDIDTHTKPQQKPRDQERGSLERQKLLNNNFSTPATHHRRGLVLPYSMQAETEWGA